MIRSRIDFEALCCDRFAAFCTPAILAVVDPLEGRGDAPKLSGAARILRLGHGLLLQGVLPRKPADRLLVEFYSLARLSGLFRLRNEFGPAPFKTGPEAIRIDTVGRCAHACFSQRPVCDCFQ